MKYLYTLLLCLVCLPCFAMETVNPFVELQGNTVFLTDGNGHGSGVLFTRTDQAGNERTLIWTAAHVANIFMDPQTGTFNTLDVVQGDFKGKAKVLRAGDEALDADCAVLELIKGEGFNGSANFYRAFNHIEVGQEVIICGTPLDALNERLVSVGIIAYVERLFDDPYMVLEPRLLDQVDITAYPGNSGGPVVDRETGDIVGLLVMRSAPRLTIIETTRNMYDWAKQHDCLWAFDREVVMPVDTPAWRGDVYNRMIEERDTGDVDSRWGDPLPEPEVDIADCTLISTITRIINEILEDRFPPILEIPEPDQINPDPVPPVVVPPVVVPPVVVPPVVEDLPPYPNPVEPVDPADIITVEVLEDGTIITRDADGNLIKVVDPVDDLQADPPVTSPTDPPFIEPSGYQHWTN